MIRKTLKIRITGTVQGVFYRSETQKKATELGITGWVKNNDDGSVSIVAQGEAKNLEKLVLWCHEGPPAARVDHVEIEKNTDEIEFDSFEIRYH